MGYTSISLPKNEPVSVYYDFQYTDNIESLEQNILFEPLLYFGLNENPLKSDERLYPMDFEFPFSKRILINFTIPEGYNIDNLPSSRAIQLKNGLGGLNFNCSILDDKIQVVFNFNINKGLIFPEYYIDIQGLFAEYVNITKSKIILSKIEK